MGFFAGFGEGFSRSFEQQRQRSHERETDEFRYRMESLIKKKDKIDEYKRDDAKNAGLAKAIVENSGAPPEAVGTAYGMLRDGASYNDVAEVFAKRKFSVVQKKEPKPEGEETDVASSDQQMQDSGLSDTVSTASSVAPATPLPTSGLDGGGFLSKIFPGMKKFSPAKGPNRVDERVSQVSGMSPEEIAQIDQGYESPDMNTGEVTSEAIAQTDDGPKNLIEARQILDQAQYALKQDPENPDLQAAADQATRQYQSTLGGASVQGNIDAMAQGNGSLGTQELVVKMPDGSRKVMLGQAMADGTFTTEDGQPLPGARTRSADEVKLAQDIQKSLVEPATKYNEKAANLSQAYTAFGNAQKIIADNPRVLQERTASLTQYLVDFGKDVQAGFELINESLHDPASANPDELESVGKKLEGILNDPSTNEMQKLAAAKGMLNVQYAIGAYHVAAAKGQDGRNLSEAERRMFSDLPEQATNPEQWNQLIGSVLVPEKQALDKQAQLLPKINPMYEPFKTTFGYSPVGDFNTMETYLEGTPGADLDRTLPQSGFAAVVTPNEAAPKSDEAPPADSSGYTYVGKTPDGKDVYQDKDGNKFTKE